MHRLYAVLFSFGLFIGQSGTAQPTGTKTSTAHHYLESVMERGTVIEVQTLNEHSCARTMRFLTYLTNLNNLKTSLHSAGFPTDSIARVLYPAAAHDSGIASLFGNADIVALDNHAPFPPHWSAADSNLPILSGQGSAYLRLRDIASEAFLAARILGGLIDSGHTIHSAQAFSVHGDESQRRHLRVVFSRGPRGPRREYIQIHAEVPNTESALQSAWWLPLIAQANSPIALIAKSANHSVSPEGNPVFHSYLETLLKTQGGIVLEGLRTRGYRASMGAAEFWGGNPNVSPREGVDKAFMEPFPGRFGYGDSVRALRYPALGRF